jgi:hypothetical protein
MSTLSKEEAMKRAAVMLTFAGCLIYATASWPAEADVVPRALLLKKCGVVQAPDTDAQAIRNLINALPGYYNSANSAQGLQNTAGAILDPSITYIRPDFGGPFAGLGPYFQHVTYDFSGWSAHHMDSVKNDGGTLPIKVYIFDNDPSQACTYVQYDFSYTPSNPPGPAEPGLYGATWNFKKSPQSPFGWVMTFANIYHK